ncbi:MAG: 23S rRNA pseudouridine(1911/1915/1917) synthase RluD [Pseudomonadota bacterium]
MSEQIHFEIPDSMAGKRIDQVLASELGSYSRGRLQTWLREGVITVDGLVVEPKKRVSGGEIVAGTLEPAPPPDTVEPENIPLDILFEDDAVLVINKPAGLVMHIAPGNYTGTLQNALLFHRPDIAAIPRAGIVHRLDKDTSGVLMIAKTLEAHHLLVQQLQARTVHRIYHAVVIGVPVAGTTIDAPIGRHPVDRKKMAVVDHGKPAITHFRVAKKFKRHSHVTVKLETGRTHQIRVHMAHIRYPLIGDDVYGGRRQIPAGLGDLAKTAVMKFPRQALHAAELGIVHPLSGDDMQWSSPLPDDMQRLLNVLTEDSAA